MCMYESIMNTFELALSYAKSNNVKLSDETTKRIKSEATETVLLYIEDADWIERKSKQKVINIYNRIMKA